MLLWLLIPVIERGKNGKASYSREYYNLYSIPQKIDFSTVFTENNNGYCYLTVKGALTLARLAKADKIGIVAEHLTISDKSVNFGINGEITINENIQGFIKASKQDDKNGIDGYFFNMPVQIKSCVHGALEYISNVLYDENKKRGISVINASLNDLYEIIDK